MKKLITIPCIALTVSAYASSRLNINNDDLYTLFQLITNLVTFLIGLYINPKK